MSPNRNFRWVALSCLVLTVLTCAGAAGCGQRGPLYLPDQTPPPASQQPENPADDRDEDESEDETTP